MAANHRKKFQIKGNEHKIWHTLLNENNLENATDVDSKKGMEPQKGHEFRWEIGGFTIEGKITRVDTPGTSNTKLVFDWRYTDLDLQDIWPPDHFASTELTLANVNDEAYVELFITNIPGTDYERTRAGKLWEEEVIRKLDQFLDSDPYIEKAA